MESILKFNQLQGKIVSRKELESLYQTAQKEEQTLLASRIEVVLKAYPNSQNFEIHFDEEAVEQTPSSALATEENDENILEGLGATALDEDTIAFNKAILKAKREGVNPREVFKLGKAKRVLANIVGELEMRIEGAILKKAMTKDKEHILYWEDFINLPDKVNEPLAVFKSKTKKDSFVILTEIINYKEKPVIVPIRIFRKGNFLDIRSLYSRVNSNNTYKKWGESGLALYVNKESNLSFKVFKGTIPSVDDKPLSKSKTTKKSHTTKKDDENILEGLGATALHEDTIAFNKAILKAKREGVIENSIYSLGKSKDILKSIIGEHEIFISGKVIKKAMTKDKDHIATFEHFINLPDTINRPIAIFKSKSRNEAKIVLLERKTFNGSSTSQ